ncbi:beta-glucosidase 12-like [Nicotiana sylvestris]|uniref:Beta-glucosidase 12-like n=1 Tax=Nicotiana sylvestris TaxID=4096 RepID=A0A1U7XUB1_NICSY|nr:PREDICTED: beta-glucosidase 12-like [Nicotiana sylvestris]
MAIKGSIVNPVELAFLCTFVIFANCIASTSINRNSFPDGFLIGASSSAYQYEGAAYEDGKGPSIWDNFTHKFPGKISEGNNGDVGDNFYHMYKDDVKLMKFVGLDAFRFSISWSRILPRGKLSGGVNKEGIAFYNNLINELLSNGIQPFVTIYHWDLPQTLEDEYSGFLSPLVVNDFVNFAELCFKEFGDRVKHWITMNEPYIFTNGGYDSGNSAPGRCSPWQSNACANGNSATEPYVVAHHLILCHAATVSLYKEKYQESQKGEIGITLVSQWLVPYSNSELDIKAAQRYIDFMYGWFMDPLVYGKYPSIMRTIVGERLPNFTREQAKMVKGSFDFIGLNYYTSNYAAHLPPTNNINVSSATDPHVHVTGERDGVPIGDPTAVSFFFDYPKGLRDLLVYTKEKYNDPTIYITETGLADRKNVMKDAIKDRQRVNFYRGHLLAAQEAIELGVKVNGFFAWSFLDTFEWTDGYKLRFGMCYVDYTDGLKRYPKYSALWFRKHFHKEAFKLHYRPRRMSSWIPRILRSYM